MQTFIGGSIKIMITFPLRILKQIYTKGTHCKLTENQNKFAKKNLICRKGSSREISLAELFNLISVESAVKPQQLSSNKLTEQTFRRF